MRPSHQALARPLLPHAQKVVFAPQRHGQRPGAEVLLVLDCGHSAEWPAADAVPNRFPCTSCNRGGPHKRPTHLS